MKDNMHNSYFHQPATIMKTEETSFGLLVHAKEDEGKSRKGQMEREKE